MTNEKAIKQADNMAVLTMNGNHVVLPIEDAVNIILLFKNAKKYVVTYHPVDKDKRHIGGDLHEIKLHLLSAEAYVEGLVNGPVKGA